MLISRIFFRRLLFPLGFGLLLVTIFFQEGTALNNPPHLQPVNLVLSPTPDRLAEPTLPAAPSPADIGSQVYWLNCSPCHGDRGQGLTDEFRQLYPPEDQNCWTSHCHGKMTYENGFTVPQIVPAVIGPGALQKFPTAATLFGFTKALMPFQKPGSLTDEQYYQILSFFLRENRIWVAPEGVTALNADKIQVGPPPLTLTPTSTPTPVLFSETANSYILFFIVLLVLILLLFLYRAYRKRLV